MTQSIATAWSHVLKIVGRAEPLGVLTTPSGARAVGHVPLIGPRAYLHTVFPPLGREGLAAVATEVRRTLPEQYRELLQRTNGLLLFGSSLYVYGLRTSYARDGRDRFPFSGDLSNTLERPPRIPDHAVVVGGYGKDGSKLFVDENGAARCDRDSGVVLNRWASLAEWLAAETDRMSDLYLLPKEPAHGMWPSAPPPIPDIR